MRGRRARLVLVVLMAAAFASSVPSSPVAGQSGSASQTMTVAGLERPAEILVDRWGVPHIYARTFGDAFFAQGFNAARDRLFQIDLWRRRGLGRLAEVLGPDYVESDKAARLFLYRGDMAREWSAYGPNAERMATAFAAGINAYVDWVRQVPDRLPIEFTLLGYAPSRWEAGDVVRIRSHGLTGNLTGEVARSNTVCRTDARTGPAYDQFRVRLEPAWQTTVPEGLDPCLPADVLRVFALATASPRLRPAKGENARQPGSHSADPNERAPDGNGSNNWVIAPAKSATGRPIMANDPHRAYSTPSLRYIAHVSGPGFDVIGAGEPFLPGLSIGHNGAVAFGLTRFYIDQEDLYAYDLNPGQPREYRYRSGWEAMRVVRERIEVRNAAPVDVDLMFTRHGPVIHADPAGHRAYAVRTGWQEAGMSAYFGSASYMFATDVTGFGRALGSAGTPGLNYVYADAKGNIGWSAAGLTPIRPNWDGLMPVPGDGRYEWRGFLPPDSLPRVLNPASGHWSTSNEMNLPAAYPFRERKLGFEWANGSRHARIEDVLNSLPRVSVDDSMRLQNDFTSLPARRLVKLLAPLGSGDGKIRAALELLRGWDGVERADSAQAALMQVWISRHLGTAFLEAVVPRNAAETIRGPDMAVMLEALEYPEKGLAAQPDGAAIARRDRLLLASLRSAYLEMEQLQGTNSGRWAWGSLHRSQPRHAMFDMLDARTRARLQPGPFPAGGSAYTPNQAGYRASDFEITSGPSFRIVIDVGAWDNSRAVNYPGQSGNPDDPHYRDLTDMWRSGGYFPLVYTRAAVEKATERRVVLMPARAR
jgi:penicillin amidase